MPKNRKAKHQATLVSIISARIINWEERREGPFRAMRTLDRVRRPGNTTMLKMDFVPGRSGMEWKTAELGNLGRGMEWRKVELGKFGSGNGGGGRQDEVILAMEWRKLAAEWRRKDFGGECDWNAGMDFFEKIIMIYDGIGFAV